MECFPSPALGPVTRSHQDAPITALDNYFQTGLFVQDAWRVTSRLTLNIGLPYDLQTPPTDPHKREATFELGVQSKILPTEPWGLLVANDPGISRGIVPAQKCNFSPRLR